MVEIKLLDAKYAAAAGHGRGLKRSPRLKQDHKLQPDFSKRRSGCLKRGAEIDLLHMKLADFNVVVTSLKNSSNTALRLYNRSAGGHGEFEPVRFRHSDPRACAASERFSRALARAVGTGGWVQELELGFYLSRQDVKVLSQALSCSSSLQHLSLANSALGDARLQHLARALCDCLPLQVLDLSGCALTDASATSVTSIIKVGVRRTADTEWRLSLRESGGSRLKRRAERLAANQGLKALDLSLNMFSDATSRQLCDVLRFGAPLEALNLQGNQLRRKSAQMYLLVYQTWGVPRLVDLRNNLDGKDIGVLEDGRHLRSFSSGYAPFWNASSLLGSTLENLPEKERNPSSRRQKLRPRGNRPPGISLMRDRATSGDISCETIPTRTSSTTVAQGTREHPDHRALVDWTSSINRVVPRESTEREECLPGPQGNDQSAVQVSIKPLIPSLCLGGEMDQISPLSCSKAGDQIFSIIGNQTPTLDNREEDTDLLESKNMIRQSDDLYGDLRPTHSNQLPSDHLRGRFGEGSSRALSPIPDPATPELTRRKHPLWASNMEEPDTTNPRSRTSEEIALSSFRRDRRSVDSRDCTLTKNVSQDTNIASGRQPAEWEMRRSTQSHSKQSSHHDHKRGDKMTCKKITDPKLVPGKDLGHRPNSGPIINCQNLTSGQRARPSQQNDPVHSTSEWQREESEWGVFMWEMARSLMHLQEGLDVLMEPSKPEGEIVDDVTTVTELHQMFAAFSS